MDSTGNPQMEPVGNGDWIRAEDHADALATARDDALRDVVEKISAQVKRTEAVAQRMATDSDIRFWDTVAGNVRWCRTMVQAMIGQPAPSSADQVPEVVGYTNYRGEHSHRSIIPQRVWYGSTEYHPNPQWFLKAFDTDKQADRDFALCDFGEAPSQPTPPREVTVQEAARVLLADRSAMRELASNAGFVRCRLEAVAGDTLRAMKGGE